MKIEWTKSMTKKALIYIFAGTGILLAMFGGFWLYGKKRRIDML